MAQLDSLSRYYKKRVDNLTDHIKYLYNLAKNGNCLDFPVIMGVATKQYMDSIDSIQDLIEINDIAYEALQIKVLELTTNFKL